MRQFLKDKAIPFDYALANGQRHYTFNVAADRVHRLRVIGSMTNLMVSIAVEVHARCP